MRQFLEPPRCLFGAGMGSMQSGPQRKDIQLPDALDYAMCGGCGVTRGDYVIADDSGVIFIQARNAQDMARIVTDIQTAERRQATRIREGHFIPTADAFQHLSSATQNEPGTYLSGLFAKPRQ